MFHFHPAYSVYTSESVPFRFIPTGTVRADAVWIRQTPCRACLKYDDMCITRRNNWSRCEYTWESARMEFPCPVFPHFNVCLGEFDVDKTPRPLASTSDTFQTRHENLVLDNTCMIMPPIAGSALVIMPRVSTSDDPDECNCFYVTSLEATVLRTITGHTHRVADNMVNIALVASMDIAPGTRLVAHREPGELQLPIFMETCCELPPATTKMVTRLLLRIDFFKVLAITFVSGFFMDLVRNKMKVMRTQTVNAFEEFVRAYEYMVRRSRGENHQHTQSVRNLLARFARSYVEDVNDQHIDDCMYEIDCILNCTNEGKKQLTTALKDIALKETDCLYLVQRPHGWQRQRNIEHCAGHIVWPSLPTDMVAFTLDRTNALSHFHLNEATLAMEHGFRAKETAMVSCMTDREKMQSTLRREAVMRSMLQASVSEHVAATHNRNSGKGHQNNITQCL